MTDCKSADLLRGRFRAAAENPMSRVAEVIRKSSTLLPRFGTSFGKSNRGTYGLFREFWQNVRTNSPAVGLSADTHGSGLAFETYTTSGMETPWWGSATPKRARPSIAGGKPANAHRCGRQRTHSSHFKPSEETGRITH